MDLPYVTSSDHFSMSCCALHEHTRVAAAVSLQVVVLLQRAPCRLSQDPELVCAVSCRGCTGAGMELSHLQHTAAVLQQ